MALTKITTSVVAVNSLTAANIADNSIDATKIANNQILARHIAAGALSDQIAANSITAAMIPNATALTLDGGVTIDNFNIDGSTIALSSGNLGLDSAGNIGLDAGSAEIHLVANDTTFGKLFQSGNDLFINNPQSNEDIIFSGNDGGSTITALTLDMSEAGNAIFNHDILLSDDGQLRLGNSSDLQIFHSGGVSFIRNQITDQDLYIQGNDGGSIITALLLDMSDLGTAYFNSSIIIPDNLMHTGDLNTYIGFPADDNFRIVIGGTETVRIDANQRIGIHKNAPKATLHIKPTGNAWEDAILLEHPAATTGWNIHPETQDSALWFGYNANTAATLTDQTASEYVVFDSSGGVGIGNSRPSTNAHAAANNLVIGSTSTGDNGMTILGNANNTGRIFFGDPDLNRTGQIEYVHNGDEMQFYAGNALSTKMIAGKFGIGVTPSEAFHTYVASGSNEYRNQLGSNSVYIRHGISRNSPQGANAFDILGLSNQDIIIGTSNMFLVGDGGVLNSEASNRLRVDANGVTIGEVLPTLSTTNESVLRRLWVRGQGVFHSQDQGTLLPRARTSALNIGPSGTRGTTGNPGTAGYNATTPTGHVSGGIAWDHLMNYSTYGNMGYNSKPHAWLGMELHSTPGHELSNMIMCTREATASTSEPLIAQRWYATGEITTPRNPAFHAYGGSLANQTTEGNHGSWTESFDRSGDYVGGTTNVFTAPVDGIYAFYVHCNFNTGSSTPYYWRAVKNNGLIGIFYGSGANQGWDHIMAFITVVLDKNDTFEWYYKGDPDEGVEWAQLGGYLIG